MTMEDYLWNYSIPMIKIMGMDNSHVNNLDEDEAKGSGVTEYNADNLNVQELNNDQGIKIDFSNN